MVFLAESLPSFYLSPRHLLQIWLLSGCYGRPHPPQGGERFGRRSVSLSGRSLGCMRPLPAPGIQLCPPGLEFQLLRTVPVVTMGPILQTLENTAPGERTDYCWTQGPSVPQWRPGRKRGKARHSALCVSAPVTAPRQFWAMALKSQNKNLARGYAGWENPPTFSRPQLT